MSVYKKPLTPPRGSRPYTTAAKPVIRKVYGRYIPKRTPYSSKPSPFSRRTYRGPLVMRRNLQIPGRRIYYPGQPSTAAVATPTNYTNQVIPQGRYVPGYGYCTPVVPTVTVQGPSQSVPVTASPATQKPACHTCGKKTSGCTTISGFAFSSAHLPVAHQQLIKQVALKILNQNVNAVILTGHTDTSGKENYNKILGARRAGAVMRALKKQLAILKPNAAKELFWKIRSRGERKPISKTNAAANRRVHICLKKLSF